MKLKHLLALAAMSAIGGGSADAQIVSGTDYLIQNVETGYYFAGGRDYGTHGTLLAKPQFFTFTTNGSGFSLDSHQYNNATNHFLGTNLYVDGGATAWNVVETSTPGVYTIENGGNYLAGNGFNANIKTVTDANDAAAQWKLISKADIVAMQENATIDDPVDVTAFIKAPEFKRNSNASQYPTWKVTAANGSGTPSNYAFGGGDKVANCAESYHANNGFNFSQTISDLKAGTYRFDAKGFYSPANNSGAKPYVFVDNQQSTLCPIQYGENSMAGAYASFLAGRYSVEPIYFHVDDNGSVNIGVHGETNANLWNIWGELGLTYYGNVTVAEVLLASYVADYNAAMTAANGLNTSVLSSADQAAFATIVSDNTVVLATATAEQLTAATTNLNNAVATYSYKIRVAELAAQGNNTDFTSLLVNPGFEEGNMSGWTDANPGIWNAIMTRANGTDPKVGTYWVEKYGQSGKIDIKQTVIGLPKGHYRVSVIALDQASKVKLVANTAETAIVGGTKATYTVDIMLDDNSDLTLGLYCDSHVKDSWVGFDDFHLTYVSSEFPELPAAVEGKMNATIAQNQTDAIAAYTANNTVVNYNAATAAIAAAQNSKAQYDAAAIALPSQKALIDGTNIYAAGWTTGYVANYNAKKEAYDNNTLNEAVVNPAAATGWHASTAYNFLLTPWTIGGEPCNEFDKALYINTWSNEGENDGSNFTVPFFEYWVGDDLKLGNNTLAATVNGLENGLYSATAWVRVRTTNGVAATDATGINLVAGDGTYTGTEGNGTVDATEGTQIGETQFTISEVTAYGLVKNGSLNIAFNIADANISWLSYKNVKYAKVRDLTDDEAAVVPTAIALNQTEATLTAANNTVTLEVTYTPADATEGIEWTTSDANVATVNNGVVTGVAPGTATITATSTLDENVKATCEVTVSYPETAYETSIEEVDAKNKAQLNVTTLSSTNLIKNGSFEYPNGVANWTAANNEAMTIGNFQIGEEEGNHYLKATANAGGGDAKSIGTAWAIEAGKTYVFSYKVKNGSNGNSEYHKVTLTNTPGTETKQVSDNATPVTTSWTTVSYQFTNSDNYAYVQFRGRWLGTSACFDDFYLAEVTETSQIGNVQYAIEQIPATNVGTAAFQYSQDAIDATNALVQGTATVEDVENAAAAMKVLNAPTAGQKFNAVLTYAGWTYDNKAITYIVNGRNDAGLYNIQYKAAANANYAQAFTMTQVEGNKYKMSQTDNDGVERYISTGVPYGGNTAQIRTTTDASKALVVEVIATTKEGVYNLKNTEANQYIGSQDAGVYTVNSHIDFNIVEATKATANLVVTEAQYGTFIAPFAAEIPEGVTAYKVSELTGADVLTLEEDEDGFDANTPYIVFSENVVNETLNDWGLATADTYKVGLLTGTYTAIPAPADSYVLQQNGEGKVGFYQVDEEVGKPTVGANRCYLTYTAPAGARVRALYFNQDTATGIDAISALANGEIEAIYNANGVKVPALQKGMNIVKMLNGTVQKVLVK